MFDAQRADICLMAPLVETRWTRYGPDRVYLKTADGAQIGHVDLKSGTLTVESDLLTGMGLEDQEPGLLPLHHLDEMAEVLDGRAIDRRDEERCIDAARGERVGSGQPGRTSKNQPAYFVGTASDLSE